MNNYSKDRPFDILRMLDGKSIQFLLNSNHSLKLSRGHRSIFQVNAGNEDIFSIIS